METQSPIAQQASLGLGEFDDILRDLDAWAVTARGGVGSRPGTRPDPDDPASIAAQAHFITLQRGLYSLRTPPGAAAVGGTLPVDGVHVGVPPGQAQNAVSVVPTDERAGFWLGDAEDLIIVKVRAQTGCLIITRYGEAAAPAGDPIEIVRLDLR